MRRGSNLAMQLRPVPPTELRNQIWVPAPELDGWARRTFLDPGSPLYNPDHDHLQHAAIGWLWTCCDLTRQGRMVVGTCELPECQGGKWARDRYDYQLRQWFGEIGANLSFLITIYGPYAKICSDATFCALVEHELYHCGLARDPETGEPKETRDGMPKYAIRGHDVEEFTGVVARYGAGSASVGVQEMVDAASRKPEIAAADIAGACGVCARKR